MVGLVVDSGCACRNFARGVTLGSRALSSYIIYPGKKKYQVGEDRTDDLTAKTTTRTANTTHTNNRKRPQKTPRLSRPTSKPEEEEEKRRKRENTMKLLTLNFLTCARKTCKSSPAAFPLHPQEAELEQIELDLNPLFIKNILPRLDWTAMKTVANEVRNSFFFSF